MYKLYTQNKGQYGHTNAWPISCVDIVYINWELYQDQDFNLDYLRRKFWMVKICLVLYQRQCQIRGSWPSLKLGSAFNPSGKKDKVYWLFHINFSKTGTETELLLTKILSLQCDTSCDWEVAVTEVHSLLFLLAKIFLRYYLLWNLVLHWRFHFAHPFECQVQYYIFLHAHSSNSKKAYARSLMKRHNCHWLSSTLVDH